MRGNERDAAGYRPQASGPMKLYLVRHAEHGEEVVNGRNKYEAVTAAAKRWRVPWSRVARECEYIVLTEEGPGYEET